MLIHDVNVVDVSAMPYTYALVKVFNDIRLNTDHGRSSVLV